MNGDGDEGTQEERLQSFLGDLRATNSSGPGRGLRRIARLVRGGAGLASSVLSASRSSANKDLSARDLLRLQGMVKRLGELKGLPMKLGQIMSYMEIELPEEGRALLGLLQTQAPATPFAHIEEIVREDLPDLSAPLLDRLERAPLSIASIGQVHRATLPGGDEVAVKVRHPGIEEAIASDFRAAKMGSGLGGLMIPGMGATVRDFMKELETRLLEECDYELEAERQRLFGRLFADHSAIVVPEVHGTYCGPRVLTTAWKPGATFEAFRQEAPQSERDLAGAALFDFYIGSLYRHGLFHADPHPGNYCFAKNSRVVVFDYGCVRVFDPEVARAFVSLAEAVRSDERARVCKALQELGAEPSKNDDAYEHLRRLLRSFFGPMLVEGRRPVEGRIVIDMAGVMRDKIALARLRLPARLLFLFRIRFGLFSVLSRLGAVCDWARLEQELAEQSGLSAPMPPG